MIASMHFAAADAMFVLLRMRVDWTWPSRAHRTACWGRGRKVGRTSMSLDLA